MAITIKHAKTDTISDWTQSDLDAQIAAGNYPAGTLLANIVLPSDWNNDHTFTGTLGVSNGGTGATTLTGYVKGNGTSAFTASSTVPSTDVTGLGTMSTQNSNAISVTGGTMSGVTISDYIATTQKAVANGVATLDSGGKVPVSQIPALGDLNYQGTWNASTNSPTLTSSVGTKGYYYVVSVAGSTNLDGITDWQIGDWAVYNGSAWQKIDNTDAVTSVNSKTGTVVLTYSDITSGVVPVVNGGTGVTTSSGANSVVLRDANANITTNCLFEGFISQVAGTLITLTASSVQNWVITGSGGQTIKLPDATTLPSGALFTFNNNQSSGTIVIQNNSSTTIATLQSGAFSTIVLLSNSTAAGSWDRHDQAPSNVSWSTNTLDYAGSITSATWNGTAIALNRGGTNANLTAVNGGAVYSTGTALAISAAGTSGQVLTSSGAGAPTWTTPTTGTVTSVTGTAPVVSSGGATPAISMAAATGSVSGYLTSTDWTTFNNKGSGTVTSVAALTLGTTGTDLTSTVATGTTTPVITLNVPTASASNRGVLSSADWTTFNNKGSGTVTSVTGTAPVVSSGGATPAISMAAATGSVNGYLTSTDWTTFNNKGSGSVTSASVVSANGFAGTVATATTTPAITISTSITGVLKGNGTAISAATSGTDYSAGTSALTTGILKSTTTTGALTIAVAADFPTLNQNTTGSAGSVTNALTAGTGLTASATYNGSAAITFNATGTTINSQTSAYVLVAGDAGKTISITTGGVTAPASVLAAGNIVTIYNNSGSSQTITQGTSLTLQWAGQASSSTGNRTLGLYGIATIVYISATNAVITGSGLT